MVINAALNADDRQFQVVANTAELAGSSVTLPTGSLQAVQRKPDGTIYLSIRDLPPSEVLVLDNRP